MRDRDLRASLAATGAIHPAYEYAGKLIDGRRRQAFCAELGKPLTTLVCDTLQDACSVLFVVHPQRALELARSEGATTLREFALLCGTTSSAIAQLLSETRPKKSHKRAVKSATQAASKSAVMVRRLVTFEPELYALAKEAAQVIGHRNVSRLVRDSVWRTIRENVSGAPLQPRRVQPANGARRRAG
jgi:hypothetical protein